MCSLAHPEELWFQLVVESSFFLILPDWFGLYLGLLNFETSPLGKLSESSDSARECVRERAIKRSSD